MKSVPLTLALSLLVPLAALAGPKAERRAKPERPARPTKAVEDLAQGAVDPYEASGERGRFFTAA